MRESCKYGSVRGARGNSRPYRDRREFIAALSAAAALPITAHAQQLPKIWRIGVLESASRELNTPNMNVFLKTLREYGYIDGENLVIEYRSTGGRKPDCCRCQ